MQKIIQPEAGVFLAKKRRRRLWTKVVSVLGCLVVFCTTYALILPAITAEKTVCGFEEHTHTDECYAPPTEEAQTVLSCTYESLGVHSHAETCYDADGNLICGQADYVVHTHDDNCYDAVGVLVCTLPERTAHVHTDACYTAETESHVHTDACYELQQGELICGLEENEEHQHSAECYEQLKLLTCPLEEGSLVSRSVLSCGEVQAPAHQHTESCFETMEPVRELICEIPEHVHTEACYEELTPGDPTADLETAADWEASMSGVVLTGDYRADLLAIAETQLGYRESTRNFIIDEAGFVKGYTRYGEWYGIPYGDWCAMFVSFCLRYAEVPNFPYNCGCTTWINALSAEEYGLYEKAGEYEPQPGDIIFFDFDGDLASDHVGIVSELIEETETEKAKLRTIEGNAADMVCSVTYEADSAVILGFGRLPDKETGYICEKVSHTHDAYCYSFGGLLLCPFEEHSHTEECIPEPEPQPIEELSTLSFAGDDFVVTVQYGSDAALPEGVALTVREIPADSEEYRTYYDQSVSTLAAGENTETLVFARFFDISFVLDGEIIEPAAPVSVTITYLDAVETDEEANCQAIHFAEDGPELLDVETAALEDGSTSFTHTQDGFSVTGYLVTKSYAGTNPSDVGPDSLPVDYYVCIDGQWTCVGSTKTGYYFSGDGDLTNFNRDHITVAQALSILGPYGFTGKEEAPSRITAYQQKSGHLIIYSDTSTYEADGEKFLPLSRNADHAGYNLYYLPQNTDPINGVASPESLDKDANGFYTVKVYDGQGVLLTSATVFTGGNFSYDATASGVTDWLVAYGSGGTAALTGSTITLENISSPVVISPKTAENAGSHSVTFKVMVEGQWQTVGSLPYYYSGSVNGSQRAYITSAMAAQIFGDYGYTATTAPGYHFGYSYNDIYKIYYAANTGYCMDINDNNIADGTAIQLWTSNASTAQIFRIWDSGEGYKYITPVENSAYHLNVLGGGTTDGTKLGIHTATDAASHWKLVTNNDGTVSFYNKNAPDSAVIDLPSGNVAKGNQLQIWTNGGNRYWKLVQQYRISNSTVSQQNSDGTYNIGLTPESNGDIVCYYLPAETGSNYTTAAESEINTANTCWSVSVRDDTHSVYSEGELSGMTQVAAPGGEVTVTVRNADGILWSCRGMKGESVEVEASQSGGYTTFVIKNITQPIEVTATKADPSFTVQYYANIPRFATSGNKPLKVIDTSAAANNGSPKLPWNGGSMATRSLYLVGTGQYTDQNAGVATQLYRVATTTELTKLYSDGTYHYNESPGLAYFNKLKDNESYTLSEIWILKSGKDAASTNRDDWDIYTYLEDSSFTNEAGQAVGNTILITDGTVIRLVSNTSSGSYYNGTTFYDYNISSGKNDDGRWRTGITGINIEGNYGTSSNGWRNWRSGADILAFGNANCGTGMSGYLFDGSTLNKHSSKNNGYGGATFGLASGLNSDGTIRYNEYIVAPKLFNDGDANGKQTYSGSSLTFDRVGDTYTLSSATLNNSNGQSNTLSNLQYFFNPSPTSGTTHTHIFTNNFWPMDQAAGRTDALWGAYGNPGQFQGFTETNYYEWKDLPANFPVSDDGRAHNWFFGMNFAISFSLTADYEGPLEYTFFGDDDLWVFLDGRLICDIGGVHSSIGEYVNLRDYLPVGSSGQHTLSFFYTERGASGSTCYMSFTLPSVSSATTSQDTGSLQIQKKLDLEDAENADYSGVEYEFKVELLTSEVLGSPLSQTFSYSRSDGTYGTIKSGGTVKLHQNESLTISGIPAGTFYRVTELSTQGYQTTVNGEKGYITSGKIETGAIKPASFVNTPYYELPSTGGVGTQSLTIAGAMMLLVGVAFIPVFKGRRRRRS